MAQPPGNLFFFVLCQKFPKAPAFEHASFPSEESAPESETIVAPEKKADVISPAAATDTRTITGNGAERGTATASGTGTGTVNETGRGNIATARR